MNNNYLKVYKVLLRTKGPVFIGSGKEINKKEYILDREEKCIHRIAIDRFYMAMKRRGYEKKYEDYMCNKNYPLERWAMEHRVTRDELDAVIKYTIAYGDNFGKLPDTRLQIMECMKDAYGMPYIPGSSLKGMLRTVLLSAFLSEKRDVLQRDVSKSVSVSKNRNIYLKREIGDIESKCFHTLGRVEKKSAVNDIMSGLVVSDSKPLSLDNIVLCAKIDVERDGSPNRINILREAIRPETEIEFTVTVDTSLFSYTIEDIRKAVAVCDEIVYENFLSKFSICDRPAENIVWLGGGSGFVSKTVLYSLFPGKEGIKMAQQIFEKTKVPRKHGHDKDERIGVSPHMLKCTKYKGQLYQFGMCEIAMQEV